VNERDTAETVIFDLRKKASLFLQAGDTETLNRIQSTIANLQDIYGAVKGAGGGNELCPNR
jgi:hypothetical protein